MSAIAETTKISLRNIGTSASALELGVAMLGAIALAFAFPKAGLAWLAPLGAGAVFWAWRRLSWKRAFFAGWFAGTIFFAINFSWFTYTVGDYVGSLAFAVVLIPALIEALAFALTGLCYTIALSFAPPWLAAIAGAAAFTAFEWLRSVGYTGVPFAQLGYSQTDTPLAVFAAYVGCFGVTFIVTLLGASLAQAVSTRRPNGLLAVTAVVSAAWIVCYAAWPARHMKAPTVRIAAVQGNITQTIKWNPSAFLPTVKTYMRLTQNLAPLQPQLIVLPETVITTILNYDDSRNYPYNKPIRDEFSSLAKSMRTTIVVGSEDFHNYNFYNALYTWGPDGKLVDVYDKRQLVPFVENLPARSLFKWLPDADLIGRFEGGHADTVLSADGLKFAPLICWESAFADLVHAQVRRGAQFLVVATDDAWFGASSGTYQHAQIAQMRAIENGEWVLQSAATGISGIISPTGRWTEQTALNREAIVSGNVGVPPGSLFARIGPTVVADACVLLYLAIVFCGLAWRRRESPNA